jgi:hypothetical protein
MATRKERIISAMNSRRRDARNAARKRREEADQARKQLSASQGKKTAPSETAVASD